MTCLYCGKKLGFFSRYKDTPFCSEEHLRAHQDEMERALMERLGSKISAQAGQRELAREETAPQDTKPARGKNRENTPALNSPSHNSSSHFDAPLDIPQPSARLASPAPNTSPNATPNATPRRGEVRNFPAPDAVTELAPIPAAERPIDKRSLLESLDDGPIAAGPSAALSKQQDKHQDKHQDGDPREGNICQDFFESEHSAAPALDVTKPWFAPSSFAIIVQADFCTPTLPDAPRAFEPARVEDEFAFEAESAITAQPAPAEAQAPPAAEAAEFDAFYTGLPLASGAIPTGMPTIASLTGAPAQDIWEAFPVEESLFEIELDAPPAAKQPGAKPLLLGGRPEVPMRPRHRYPYPGSDLGTRWNDRSDEFGIFPFTASDEWDGIEPAPYRNPLEDRVAAEKSEIQPQLEVQLSLSALCAQVIRESEETPFERDPESQPAVLLDAQAGLFSGAALGDWAMQAALPQGTSAWQPHFRFPKSTPARPMPAVNFPSLFQLNPAMPPRPEGVLHA